MARTLPELWRHWMRQAEKGKGIRLEAEDVDLLNAIGVGDLIATKAAERQREEAQHRIAERGAKI